MKPTVSPAGSVAKSDAPAAKMAEMARPSDNADLTDNPNLTDNANLTDNSNPPPARRSVADRASRDELSQADFGFGSTAFG